MKRVLILSILLSTLTVGTLRSQNYYSNGIGLRGGFASGITFKHFLNDKAAIEGIFSSRYRGYIITGLYEIHAEAFGVDQLSWLYGGGAHIGFFDSSRYLSRDGGFYSNNVLSIGVDGILGMEYFIGDIPITIGLDIKPFFDLVNPGIDYWGGGISIRYVW